MLDHLDAYIDAEMQKWHVPGVSVAVIRDGEVLHQKGYGTRDLDNPQPVTPETLFAIGSCTKAFTALTLALLVEEGKLDWDKPIRHYMPRFRLADVVASEQMTARDLLCHRSGLPRHDLMWYGSTRSRWELFDNLHHLQPSQPFRYVFQYQNLMYMVAGCLIETITGQTWEAFTQERILDVVGMTDSLFSVIVADKAYNVARPHEIRAGQTKRVPFRNLDALGPAGSIHSSLTDMLKWLKIHMADGQPLVSPANLKLMHQPHVPSLPPAPLDFVEIQHSSYGLGWAQHLYRGNLRIRHTGGIDGFITDVSFMPQHKIGVIVFNNGGDALSQSIAMHIYDSLLGLDTIDWRARYETANDEIKGMVNEAADKLKAARQPNAPHSHAIAAYVGEYEHPAYGILAVSQSNDDLVAVYNGLEFRLSHLHYDIFETTFDVIETMPPMPLTFHLDVQGNIAAVSLQLEPTVEAIRFARKAAE